MVTTSAVAGDVQTMAGLIARLKREDVRVLEDNVPQELSIFERETDSPLTIAILIDTSRSQEGTLPQEKTAALAFINSFLRPDRDKAAVISFTGIAVLQQGLTNDLKKLRDAVERAERRGNPLRVPVATSWNRAPRGI